MNGYGLFVWLSFGIVFFSCMIFYLKTKKTLKKYEKEFLNELKNLSESERKKVLERSKVANQVLAANSKLN
tara:strand:- start:3684 stop:3896 length:213 start_codon:yes stop_codon:yes gene_type:complete